MTQYNTKMKAQLFAGCSDSFTQTLFSKKTLKIYADKKPETKWAREKPHTWIVAGHRELTRVHTFPAFLMLNLDPSIEVYEQPAQNQTCRVFEALNIPDLVIL